MLEGGGGGDSSNGSSSRSSSESNLVSPSSAISTLLLQFLLFLNVSSLFTIVTAILGIARIASTA